MGDFHQYYYGTKTAPYLTVFIGGNHEASNHLFELHYGGWAAPNIYYLGAANVIKLGPIKIAGTSGVYKKYDYRRPHFERLPYNGSDIRSIYHQRELDIRKLLSYRSQVDVGLSHDWPTGIEWLGDHKYLFARKRHLHAEAESGDLGSRPSSLVLDRLRPPYWFSAHHHFRYPAYKVHVDAKGGQPTSETGPNTVLDAKYVQQEKAASKEQAVPAAAKESEIKPLTPAKNGGLNAWNSFKDHIEAQDAVDNEKEELALRQRVEEQERTGQQAIAAYGVEEDFREVSIVQSHGVQRRTSRSPEKRPVQQMPQLDGACCSLPKRRRKSSPSDDSQPSTRARLGGQVNGSAPEGTVTNPDAIDIDMSDSESDSDQRPLVTQAQPLDGQAEMVVELQDETRKDDTVPEKKEDLVKQPDESQRHHGSYRSSSRNSPPLPSIREVESRESLSGANPFSDAAAVEGNSTLRVARSNSSLDTRDHPIYTPTSNLSGNTVAEDPSHADELTVQEAVPQNNPAMDTSQNDNKTTNTAGVSLDKEVGPEGTPGADQGANDSDDTKEAEVDTMSGPKGHDSEISDDVRAQLAEMSSTFAPEEKIKKSADLPFPGDITNKATRFLALGKLEKGYANDFLQLLEIEPYDNKKTKAIECGPPPYELEYDPEWLAITRVFAPELELGGSSRDKVSANHGETFYRERILEEEKWVQDNIVSKHLLKVPKNFTVQTEPQDWDMLSNKEKNTMPRELTNPQTSEFCKLVGIPNPFDISEEERDARMAQGPARDDWQQAGRDRGRGGNRGNRGNRGSRCGRGRGSE